MSIYSSIIHTQILSQKYKISVGRGLRLRQIFMMRLNLLLGIELVSESETTDLHIIIEMKKIKDGVLSKILFFALMNYIL